MSTNARFGGRDAVLALLLFLAMVAYLSDLPRTLGRADESHFLYEAKRIRDGEVMYRDFFQFVTPGAPYVMALLFWALRHHHPDRSRRHRCPARPDRRRDVRDLPARSASAARSPSCRPSRFSPSASRPGSSPAGTGSAPSSPCSCCSRMVRAPWASRPRAAIIPGLATGLLMGVQQQKGFAIGARRRPHLRRSITSSIAAIRSPGPGATSPSDSSASAAGIALIIDPAAGDLRAAGGLRIRCSTRWSASRS